MITQGHIEVTWSQHTLESMMFQHRSIKDFDRGGADAYVWDDIESTKIYWDLIGLNVNDSVDTKLFWDTDPWPHLANKFTVIHKMRPGMIQPLHGDLYARYSKNNNVTDVESIQRVLIFLTDWQMGHIFHCDQQSFDGWRAGDWVSWPGTTKHVAANFGSADRYTMQITGIRQ